MADYCNKCKSEESFKTMRVEKREGVRGRIVAHYCTACDNLLRVDYPNGRTVVLSKKEANNA